MHADRAAGSGPGGVPLPPASTTRNVSMHGTPEAMPLPPFRGSLPSGLNGARPGHAETPVPATLEPVTLEPVTLEPVTLEPAALEPAALEPAAEAEPIAAAAPDPFAHLHGAEGERQAEPIAGLQPEPAGLDYDAPTPDPFAGLPTEEPLSAASTDETEEPLSAAGTVESMAIPALDAPEYASLEEPVEATLYAAAAEEPVEATLYAAAAEEPVEAPLDPFAGMPGDAPIEADAPPADPFAGIADDAPAVELSAEAPESVDLSWSDPDSEGVVEPVFEEDVHATEELLAERARQDQEFPLDAFIIPEHASRLPTGVRDGEGDSGERVTVEIAARFEQLSKRLREEDLNELLAKLARGDRLDTLLAGFLAGYLPTHDA